ncbi:hypothetical protein [Paracidovorax wautersii]|uniref:Uncharacterized protein n=1 Tax=Paracidovorax wautersii TaxID=1177982 RepID=A0A1I2E6P6_9BURK|nr:hypothetical protein [Paracidovorax wautersii]SFE88373.1 hypothetical protein SAMN04489711_106256 [Paracidovorax wautersii]
MTAQQRNTPAYLLAHGRLYRAIVSLPRELCPADEPLHERVVFFDGPRRLNPDAHLEKLLCVAWNITTFDWAANGHIYNVTPAVELIEGGQSEDHAQRLFETSWGGLKSIGYAQADRIDIFAAPELKRRLMDTVATLPRQGSAT